MNEDRHQEFLTACGMTRPLSLIAEGVGDGVAGAWSGPRPFALIGRNANADLQLDHEAVSRRHLYLQAVEGRLLGVDLLSRTGSRLGGKPWRAGWLAPKDAIGIGPYDVCIEGGDGDGGAGPDEPPIALSSRYRGGPGLPGVSLEISGPGRAPTLWRMGRVLVLVGSAPDCRLRLADSGTSRFQCSLLRTPAGLWVVDLLGEGGTFINGEYARAARLDHGDELQIGRASVRVRLDAPSPGEGGRSLRVFTARATPRALPAMTAPSFPAPGAVPRLPMPMPMVSPDWAGPHDSAVAPFVQQFGTLQQQMFDQFHQLMMAMLQTFGAMHREQMGAVREDLDRLEQITQELGQLQSRPPGPSPAPSGRVEPDPVPASAPPATGSRDVHSVPNGQSDANHRAAPSALPELDPAEIFRRVAELQHERQGRWQRIVGFLFGAP